MQLAASTMWHRQGAPTALVRAVGAPWRCPSRVPGKTFPGIVKPGVRDFYYICKDISEGVREYIRTNIKRIIQYIKYIGPDLLFLAGPDLLLPDLHFPAEPDLLFPAGPYLLVRSVRGQSDKSR